jgi:hypothetical protein
MIANDQEFKVTLDRIAQFQAQVAHLRNTESNPVNYVLRCPGFSRRSTACSSRCASI